MFCPSCGLEERQLSQFCRGCGTDLRAVRAGLERPDAVTNSAATARDEIGRAIAAKIGELRTSVELKTVAEDVLPQIEKFLESPEEKRLRRMRTGVITSSIGLGLMLMFLLMAIFTAKVEMLVPICVGLVPFFVGLGIIINGRSLTVQKGSASSQETLSQNALDQLPASATTNQRELPPLSNPPVSIIEHTTHRLSKGK